MKNQDLITLGSETAKAGFQNERQVVEKFNNWKSDRDAQNWLLVMKYDLDEIEYVKAVRIKSGHKSDVQVKITIKLKKLLDVENLQVKLVSNPKGFNQIDKRWVDKYAELWQIPKDVVQILKHFTGEIKPKIKNPRDSRRMFLYEFELHEQQLLIDFVEKNKVLIVTDILQGRGKLLAEWMLVLQKQDVNARWILKPMNVVMNFFSKGDVTVTDRGSLKIGKITVQRKGGDGGRVTANMLQFKINPAELFEMS